MKTKRKSFRRWLIARSKDETAIGDLARDVRADPSSPKPLTPATLLRHLNSINACEGAFRSLKHATEIWKRTRAVTSKPRL